jgi:CarD family transcriptional regulator
MAARKKVTKKAPKAPQRTKAPERSGPSRQKRKTKRVPAADSKSSHGVESSKAVGKAKSSHVISAATSKKGVTPVTSAAAAVKAAGARLAEKVEAHGGGKAATAPRKTAGAGGVSKPKPGQSKDINRRSVKRADPAPGRSESVAAAGLAETAAKAPAAVAAVKPAADAGVAPAAAKTSKASALTKAIDREPAGGEQKTMKNSANKHGFKLNEFVVYPAHGVGQIVAMEEQEVAGFKLELFVINFVKDKMTLRVPTSKVVGVGMRKLSDPDAARRSLEILTGRARIKRTMWSRRAQEYEAKINSGDINAIAEVVRDLYRSEAQPEQSYSERQLYEAALDRMMREIAAVQKLSETEALKVIEAQLKKNQKRGAKGEAGEGDEAGIEEAA